MNEFEIQQQTNFVVVVVVTGLSLLQSFTCAILNCINTIVIARLKWKHEYLHEYLELVCFCIEVFFCTFPNTQMLSISMSEQKNPRNSSELFENLKTHFREAIGRAAVIQQSSPVEIAAIWIVEQVKNVREIVCCVRKCQNATKD